MKPALDVIVDQYDNATLRQWLEKVLLALWEEGEGFSGKRPLGDSGWWGGIVDALEAEGYEDGDESVRAVIRSVFKP